MRHVFCATTLLVVLCAPASPAGAGRWLRRATLAAACAASFWDVQTTSRVVSRGGRELNGFLADAAGRPRWGRMIGMKAGTCAGMLLLQEAAFPRQVKPWIGLNTGLAGIYSGVAVHNLRVAGSLRRPEP